MRVIVAGVQQEVADEYAARLIEQGKAIPAPPTAPAKKVEKSKGKRPKDVRADEPKDAD